MLRSCATKWAPEVKKIFIYVERFGSTYCYKKFTAKFLLSISNLLELKSLRCGFTTVYYWQKHKPCKLAGKVLQLA